MSDISPLPPPEPTYQAIEATLAGHERGRRFLAEHARRSRHEGTAALMDAVARLHDLAAEASANGPGPDLATLRDLTATAAAGLAEATGAARGEDDDISAMVEGLQATAWSMREAGTDAALCDLLDSLAVRLDRACHGREQRNLALARARAAVSRLGQHLADRACQPAGWSGEPADPESDGEALTGPHDPAIPDRDHLALASASSPAVPARPRRKSRTRSTAPDRG